MTEISKPLVCKLCDLDSTVFGYRLNLELRICRKCSPVNEEKEEKA